MTREPVDEVQEVGCRFCGADRGRPCVDTRTGREGRHCRSHPSRIRDAERSVVGADDEHDLDEWDGRG